MLSSIHTIKDAVNQIKRSIHFIDAISRQSHLLALNASIEAARLGESGKGFSVIADEMQELSLRSSHTAKETTSLIQACLMATSEGTSSIAETAQAIDDIIIQVSDSHQMITSISKTSKKQAVSLHIMLDDIKHIAEVAHTLSSFADSTAIFSETLSSEAQELNAQLSFFLK